MDILLTLNAVNAEGSNCRKAAHTFYKALAQDSLVSNLIKSLQRNLSWEKEFKRVIVEEGTDKLMLAIQNEQIKILTLLFQVAYYF